jgi:hypothetical protein
MPVKNSFVAFGAGLMAGVVATIALSGNHAIPRAMAQDQNTVPGLTQRYQVSSWAHPGAGGIAPSHGAYIIDTQTGKVWGGREGERLKPVGRVE